MNQVPFFRPRLPEEEIAEVVATLRDGWLTTGPRTKLFEQRFADAVGARHAVALNSCTAALHLAVEALGLKAGQAVLVPAMTFAATAEVVRYQGATPILVDCDPDTGNMDLADAERKIADAASGSLEPMVPAGAEIVGIMPVHVGGLMMDVSALKAFASRYGLWIVEDAAHAFPAAWRTAADQPWQRAGEQSANVTCFSFYANKTITTGEGGMAVTHDEALADRIRLMSLHGLSRDAWTRYTGQGSWDYRIIAPGYKYNLTDVASAIGLHQLNRAEALRLERERLAGTYHRAFADEALLRLPSSSPDRVHAWHLFPVRLVVEQLAAGRDTIFDQLRQHGIVCSVHWRPLHLHTYYQNAGWRAEHCPAASDLFERNISLPLFPGMTDDEQGYVVERLLSAVAGARKARSPRPRAALHERREPVAVTERS